MAEKDRQKIVQLIADQTRANSLLRVAPAHSLTLDLESCELVVHDGITQGGICRIGMPGAGGGLATQLAPGALRVCSDTNILTGDGSPSSQLCIDLGQLNNDEALEIAQAIAGESAAVQVIFDSIKPLLEAADIRYLNNGNTNVSMALDDIYSKLGALSSVATLAPITGDGTTGDPITLDPEDLNGLVEVVVDAVTLGGLGTIASPLAIIAVQTGNSISGQGTVANPLEVNAAGLSGLVPVATDTTLNGDGTTASALSVNFPSLNNAIEVATDASISGVGTTANPLSVAFPATVVATDGTIDGTGTAIDPLNINAVGTVTDIVADTPALTTLATAVNALSIHTVNTNATIDGDGSVGNPLGINQGTVLVASDTTLLGDGTTGNPLEVANPFSGTVTTDTTLTGNGQAVPLSVVGANLTNIPYSAITGHPAQTGEANTASNLGSGEGFFSQKNLLDLQFKTLTLSRGFAVTSNAGEVNLATGRLDSVANLDGGVNGRSIYQGENIGGAGQYQARLRELVGGGGIDIVQNTSTLDLTVNITDVVNMLVADPVALQLLYAAIHAKMTDFTAGVLSIDCNGDGNPLT